MMMSLYAGVSGLKSQQTKLNVIGNNIANINTTGYKEQTVSFADLLSQTISSATGSSSTKGGTNAKQIGLGTNVSAISTNMSTGSTQYTGLSTDLAIGGNGFFIVQGGSKGEYQFTRAGNLSVDSSGNLTVNGLEVCGWQDYTAMSDGTYEFNTQKTVEPLNLYADNKKLMAAKATTEASLMGNLDPTTEAHKTALDAGDDVDADDTTTMTVYDAQGNSFDVQVNFYKYETGTDTGGSALTTWKWEVASSTSDIDVTNGSGYIQFNSSGDIITSDTTYSTTPSITLTPSEGGTDAFPITLNLADIATYTSASNSGVSVSEIDGYKAGELQDFSIDANGVITGTYSNGETQPLAMLGLANFTNPAGLEKIGTNLYVTSTNSGDFTGGVAAGSGGTGSLSSGVLEMSNVDLAQEFSEMMITQRAYQANSKVISTSDDILEILMNMTR